MKIKLKGHGEPISAIDFSPNGQFFASGSQDRQVMIWDLSNPSERPAMTLSGHTGNIRFLRFTADNSQVVTVSEGGQLVLWNLASGARVKELHFESGMIATSVAMSPDFRKVAIGSFDGRVALYELFLGLL